jgi:hypothetical protein
VQQNLLFFFYLWAYESYLTAEALRAECRILYRLMYGGMLVACMIYTKSEAAADHHYTRNMFTVAFCQLRNMLLQWRPIICHSVGIWKRWSVLCDSYIYLVIFKSKWWTSYNTFWYSKSCTENLTLGQTDPNHKNNFFLVLRE